MKVTSWVWVAMLAGASACDKSDSASERKYQSAKEDDPPTTKDAAKQPAVTSTQSRSARFETAEAAARAVLDARADPNNVNDLFPTAEIVRESLSCEQDDVDAWIAAVDEERALLPAFLRERGSAPTKVGAGTPSSTSQASSITLAESGNGGPSQPVAIPKGTTVKHPYLKCTARVPMTSSATYIAGDMMLHFLEWGAHGWYLERAR